MNDMALYEYIHDRRFLRDPQWSWQDISDALQLGKSRGTMQKYYRRLCNRVKKPYKPEKVDKVEQVTEKRDTVQPPSQKTKSKNISEQTDLEIFRTPYGDIQPTMEISDLDNDDWIDKYIVYPYGESDPEVIAELKKEWRLPYLTELRNKIWNMEELIALLPRGYGKTESVLALFIRWFLEIREPIYIVSPSSEHSKKVFGLAQSKRDPFVFLSCPGL